MLTRQKLSRPQKLHVFIAVAGLCSRVNRILMFLISALLILASSVVAVYAAEPAVSGLLPTNHPGTGDTVSFCVVARCL